MRPVSRLFQSGSTAARGRFRTGASSILSMGLGLLLLGLPSGWVSAGPGSRPLDLGKGQARQAALAEAGFDSLTILVGGFELTGQAQMMGGKPPAEVWAQLTDAEGRLLAESRQRPAADGNVELAFESRGDAAFRPILIRPGDRIELGMAGLAPGGDEGQRSSTITVPELQVTADPEQARVTGLAPPGARIHLTSFDESGSFARLQALADADGRFVGSLAGPFEIGPGAYGSALILDGSLAFQAAWALPRLDLQLGASSFELRCRPGELLRARVYAAAGSLRGGALAYGRGGLITLGLRDAAGERLPLRGGDRLEIDFDPGARAGAPARAPIHLVLPPLDLRLDPAAGLAAGRSLPGSRIRLSPAQAPELAFEVAADARYGFFRADLPFALEAGDAVLASVIGLPAVSLLARAPAWTELDPHRAEMRGQGQAGAAILAQVYNPAGQLQAEGRGRIGPDGRFELTAFALGTGAVSEVQALDSASTAGDVAWQLAEGEQLSLEIEAFEPALGNPYPRRQELRQQRFTYMADAGSDRLWGQAPGGSNLRIRLTGEALDMSVQADPAGLWSADLAGLADIRAGTEILIEAQGSPNSPLRNFAFRSFRATAQANGERVRIEGPPGLEAGVEVERAGSLAGIGRCRIAEGAGQCEALIQDEDGRPLWLAGDDLVAAMALGLGTAAIDSVPMTAHIDARGRDVVGVAPAEDQVEIRFHNDQGDGLPLDTGALTDENGVYDHELVASEWDQLVPGLQADVFYQRGRGHRQMARGVIEQLRYHAGQARLSGVAEPGALVTATLHSGCGTASRASACGGPILATVLGRVPGDGLVDLKLRDPESGEPLAKLGQGQLLALTHSRGRIDLPLEAFSAWQLDTAGSLAGVGRPFTRVRAHYVLRGAAESAGRRIVEAWTGHDGRFQLSPPDMDPSQLRALALYQDMGEGGELALDLEPARGGGAARSRIFLPRIIAPAAHPLDDPASRLSSFR